VTNAQGIATFYLTDTYGNDTGTLTASVQGQSGPLYASTGTYTIAVGTPSSANSSASPSGPTNVTAGQIEPLTFTFLDASGNPVSGAPVTFALSSGSLASALFGASSTTVTTTASGLGNLMLYTNASGQVTLYMKDTKASDTAGAVTATATGGSGSATATTGTLTIVPGPLAKYVITGFTPGTSGTVAITAEDQYGNTVTSVTSGYAAFTSVDSKDASTDATAADTLAQMVQGSTTIGSTATAISFTNGVATLTYTKAADNSTVETTADTPEFIDTLTVQNTATSPSVTATAGGGTTAQY
jgi:adhesin/invasin